MIRFVRLDQSHLELVLRWRTDEFVTRYMYTDVENDLTKQYEWFDKIKHSRTDKYWMVILRDVPVGVISLNGIDLANRKTSWGYYIGDERHRMYGGLVPPYLYNFIFHNMGLNKITAEVMQGNENLLKLHRMHGYRDVGLFKNHILKYDNYYDVYILELLKADWDLKADKYKKYLASFEL